MKRFLFIILIVITALFALGFAAYRIWIHNPHEDVLHLDPASVFEESGSSAGLLIRNATLIDVEAGEAIPNAHLLVRGDTIAEVLTGEAPEPPPGAAEYDAGGRYVMPGLVDVHVHLAMHWSLISGEFAPRDSLVTRVALEQFVRYGVTTVLVQGGGGANDEQVVALKQLERRNAIVSPWLFAVGDQITAPGSHPITTIMRLPDDADPERLHQAGVIALAEDDDPAPIIARKKQLGLDGVKIVIESGPPPFYPRPRMSAETAAGIIEHATRHDLPVFAHVESHDELVDAVHLGVDAVMHSVLDTLIDDVDLIARMKEEQIWYVPTLSVIHGFQSLEEPHRLEDDFLQAGVSPRVLRGLEHPLFRFGFGRTLGGWDLSAWLETEMRNLARLHGDGVRVAMGTDASTPFNFPGYGAHVEMELMSRAGLSNADILRIATLNGARFLGVDDSIGTAEPGKIANLLVLDENPLLDIRNTRSIDRVVLKGHFIDPVRADAVSDGSDEAERTSGAVRPADSAFAALQERGASPFAMGVDQYTSTHLFDDLPDGGRIELQRQVEDSAGVGQIRAHLRHVTRAFSEGDFRIPGFVHDRGDVPGTDVMRARRNLIRYAYRDLPLGGQVTFTSGDPEAVAAIHRFLAFQRADHRAHGHSGR